jgi:hypothetical protein
MTRSRDYMNPDSTKVCPYDLPDSLFMDLSRPAESIGLSRIAVSQDDIVTTNPQVTAGGAFPESFDGQEAAAWIHKEHHGNASNLNSLSRRDADLVIAGGIE